MKDLTSGVASTAFENGIGELKRYSEIQGIVKHPNKSTPVFETLVYNSSGTIALPFSKWFTSGDRIQNYLSKNVNQSTVSTLGIEAVLKGFFGFGDFYGLPMHPKAAAGLATDTEVSSVLARGWKYGLINAVPTPTTARFRYDTFGQF